jgi:hypothetical protein
LGNKKEDIRKGDKIFCTSGRYEIFAEGNEK